MEAGVATCPMIATPKRPCQEAWFQADPWGKMEGREPRSILDVSDQTMRITKTIPLLLLACASTACVTDGGARKTPDPKDKTPTHEVVMDPLHLGLQPDAELGLTDFDAATLFREGLRLQEAEQTPRALLFYDRLISEFPRSRFSSAAAFNAGRCLEVLGQEAEALRRYQLITEGMPRSKDWADAMFRSIQVLQGQPDHPRAVEYADRLLARQALSVSDRIDALVLKGESLKALGQSFEAEKSLRAALRIFREHERDEYLDPAPAARAEFRMAEMLAERFTRAPLRLPEERMRQDLEAKAQLLLSAQSGFLRCMRFGDPDWATAAGYRIARLYLDLHAAMDQAPVPQDLSPAEVQVYRDMLRKRLAVLLRKALKVFEMTLQLAERTRSDNDWTRATRKEMEQVKVQVLQELEREDKAQMEDEQETQAPLL